MGSPEAASSSRRRRSEHAHAPPPILDCFFGCVGDTGPSSSRPVHSHGQTTSHLTPKWVQQCVAQGAGSPRAHSRLRCTATTLGSRETVTKATAKLCLRLPKDFD